MTTESRTSEALAEGAVTLLQQAIEHGYAQRNPVRWFAASPDAPCIVTAATRRAVVGELERLERERDKARADVEKWRDDAMTADERAGAEMLAHTHTSAALVRAQRETEHLRAVLDAVTAVLATRQLNDPTRPDPTYVPEP